MQIREGAYYRTRGCHVVGPMQKTGDCMQDDYPWSSMYECWTDDGKFNIADDECEADLISEVYVSDMPPDMVKITIGGNGGSGPSSNGSSCHPLPQNAPYSDGIKMPETKTLRDEFAMEAMKILIPRQEQKDETFAELAYIQADAMMEARKK